MGKSGVVYDLDGTTLLQTVTVTFINVDTGEWCQKPDTTNSSGEYTVDLANTESGYSNGDKIQILAHKGKAVMDARFTVVMATGSHEKDMYLKGGQPLASSCNVLSVLVSNDDGSNPLYLKLRDRSSSEYPLIIIQVPTNDSKFVYFGETGIHFTNGVCRDFEDDSNGTMEVTIKLQGESSVN